MNLCGGGAVEQQILSEPELESPPASSKDRNLSTLCGPCVKGDDENDNLNADKEIETILTHSGGSSSSSEYREDKQKIALDVIQQTIEVEPMNNQKSQSAHVFVIGLSSVPSSQIEASSSAASIAPLNTPPSYRPNNSSSRGAPPIPESPSPILLNPLSTHDWDIKHKSRLTRNKPNLVGSANKSNSTIYDEIPRRLQEGFHVKVHGLTVQPQPACIYYDRLQETLCLRRVQEEEKKDDFDGPWIQIPIRRILRLEIGKIHDGAPNSMQCFSIIANKDANIKYYDFETTSPLEREVLISTLMLVLEHVLNKKDADTQKCKILNDNQFNVGGTLDQPIPCSPSLEQPFYERRSTERHLSPRKRTEIHDMSENEGTEASLVIHLEDCATPEDVDYSPLQITNLTYNGDRKSKSFEGNGSDNLETFSDDSDTRTMGDTNKATNFELEKSPNTSAPIVPTWCSDDACSLALADLADTCSGLFALRRIQAQPGNCEPLTDDQMHMVEEYIASALGAPSAVCTYLATGNVWRADTIQSTYNKSQSRNYMNNKVQNRASQLNAQALRLRNLRNEMTFVAALRQSKEKMRFVQITQSYDDFDRNGRKSLAKAAKDVADRFHASALLNSVVNSMTLTPNEGNLENGDVLYYDSDPEDVRPRNSNFGPRRASTEKQRELYTEEKESVDMYKISNAWEKVKPSKRVSKRLDEELIIELVQAMTNDRLTLMWHPTQTKEHPNRHPICVKVWIESGLYLIDGTFLLPKLNWAKELEVTNNRSRNWKYHDRDLNKIDLLDVCRIRATAQIDRKLHPYANRQKSFSIETQSDYIVFEARSPEERDRIVYGLKLVIARLASLLMLRDARAAEEFFGAISAAVPGEAPTWAKTQNSSNSKSKLAPSTATASASASHNT